LTVIETVIRIEERFGIAMPDFEEFDTERVLTVEDLADMVMERLEARQ
jgi:acyl carrier protein